MDILGLFDGLFTAFSAMRSGKNIDEPKTRKNDGSQQYKIQSATNTYDESIKSRQAKISHSRANNKYDKEQQHDRDII